MQGVIAVPSAYCGLAGLLQLRVPQAWAPGKAVGQRETGSPNLK